MEKQHLDKAQAGTETGIVATRVWPGSAPITLPRSRVGGLPSIGDVMDWPRGGEAKPLHFLVAIDCTELPPNGDRLPGEGHLLFFAALASDAWAYEGTDACRVIHTDRLGQPIPPPTDTPREDVGDWQIDLFGSYDRTTMPEWPLVFHAIETEREPDPYGESGQRRARAIEAATGQPPDRGGPFHPGKGRRRSERP